MWIFLQKLYQSMLRKRESIFQKCLAIPKFHTWLLYDSLLNDDRDRDLRAGEMVMVCRFLGVNPMDFADESEKGE